MHQLSKLNSVCSFLGLFFMLVDIGCDIYAAVSFYQDGDYLCLGVLVSILVGSSVLVHMFSWLWTKNEFKKIQRSDRRLSLRKLAVRHVLLLEMLCRRVTVLKMILCVTDTSSYGEDLILFLQHDIGLLALFETFSESCPQLILMLTIYLQRGHLGTVNALKTTCSIVVTANSMTLYHRCLRKYLEEKSNQHIVSSLIYLIWNVFLIASRLLALGLFASVFPCYIVTHFLCYWLIFVVVAWRLKTNLMDNNTAGERLYRSTVGLIWYFNWFNVVDEPTRWKALVYHTFRVLDNLVLCGLVTWQMLPDPQYSSSPHMYVTICVVICQILGLIWKMIYYKHFHPKHFRRSKEAQTPVPLNSLADEDVAADFAADENVATDTNGEIMNRSVDVTPTRLCNKRMQALSGYFYM